MEQRPLIKTIKTLILCSAAVAANFLLHFAFQFLGIPLFMDTLFTIALSFLAGPLYGCLTALLTTLSLQAVYNTTPDILYFLCSASGVFLACFFRRRYHLLENNAGYSAFNIVSVLLTLSLYMCILMSVTGGISAWRIPILWPDGALYKTPVSFYKLGMFLNKYPVLPAEIISRFPVNIPDRLLSVYGAYGAALLLKNRFRKL
jgi:hypothetical protein